LQEEVDEGVCSCVFFGQEHERLLLVDLHPEVLVEESDDHASDLRESVLGHQSKA
jgi:hypothetical protein